jgi:hypothetical protein
MADATAATSTGAGPTGGIDPQGRTLASCAYAATAAELAYRLDYPLAPSRGVRVVALDAGAVDVIAAAAHEQWSSARFLVAEATSREPQDLTLRGLGGAETSLEEQLMDADVIMMVATDDVAADGAYQLGRAGWERSIMTAGLVVGGLEAPQVVGALRPHARVLLPSADASDVVDLLTALRA